jgi:hypothetical protein
MHVPRTRFNRAPALPLDPPRRHTARMLFCSRSLARRIERAERGLIEDATAAVARRAPDRVRTLPIAGGLAVFAGADSPLTKLVGLGFEGAPDRALLERVEADFAARGAAVQVELSTLADAGLAELFTARGYVLAGFENVLGLDLGARAARPSAGGVEVEVQGDGELETWLDVVVSAFAAPDAQGVAAHEDFTRDALERVMRDMAGARGLVRYLARRGGALAGGASLRVADGVAQLCGAGTLPAHRRKGVQAALLERRLADAARRGCDLAVVTTLPGSKSQENAQKRGFELLYARAILRRPAGG